MDYIETPSLARFYCPGCEPEVDVLREIVEAHYCHLHEVSREGADDAGFENQFYGANTEAGGESNKAVCDFLHRSAKRTTR